MLVKQKILQELLKQRQQLQEQLRKISVNFQEKHQLAIAKEHPIHEHRHKHMHIPNVSVTVKEQDQLVVVRDHATQVPPMKFPSVWLRDNCLCDHCFHKDSLSRKPMRWNNFDTNVKVQSIHVDATDQSVHIQWSDEHTSRFDLHWLRERDFAEGQHKKYLNEWYRPQCQHWSTQEFKKILKKFSYKDVIHNDFVLKEWLDTIAVYGIAMLKNAPLDIRVVQTLANRIGFIRKTTYGEEFSVKSRPGAKNYSYLAKPLPLHTDLPYYEYKPSVTILHTLEQSKSVGGRNMLVDGFHIADQLRNQHPLYFKTLAETIVDWADIGSDSGTSFHNIWRAPVINLDNDGRYIRINHSVPQRDSHFNVDVDKVVPWYKAYALFVRMAQEQAVSFKTEPGDVLTFNNLRMLHGRTGYDDTQQNIRHIVGGFVDWDIIYSRMRVLKRRFECSS